MKKIFLLLSIALLSICAFSQPYFPIYGSAKVYGDSISLGGKLKIYVKSDSVIIAGETKEFVLRDSTLLEIIKEHAGTLDLNDTIFFVGTNGVIAAPSTSSITINPNGGAKKINFVVNAEPLGLTLSGLESLSFPGTAGHFQKGFRNDSTTVAGDTAYAWSAKAIRDYVSEHGGGGASNIFVVSNDTIFLIDGSQVINLSNATSKPKIRIDNSSTGQGFTVFNSSTGRGVYIYNSSSTTGKGLNIYNSSGGQAARITNNSTGIGLWMDNYSTGTGIKVASGTAGTGDVFISVSGSFDVDTTFRVTSTGGALFGDSVKLKYEGTATSDDRLLGLSKTGKIKSINQPQGVQLEVSNAQLTTGGESGYIFAIPEALAGTNLIKMEAYPGEVTGDQTALAVTCYRRRSGTEVSMTTTGASFSVNAVINTTNDDVQRGDQLEFRWTFSGGSTAPTGLIVQLTFQKP